MAFFVAQFLLVGLVLVLPCALMGGTLPILARWLVGREDEIGARVGALYAANTLGAVRGTPRPRRTSCCPPWACARASSWPSRSTSSRALAALALARIAAGRGSRKRPPPAPAGDRPGAIPAPAARRAAARRSRSRASRPWSTRWPGRAWSALVFGSSVYAFGLMLLLFLAGIAIGSAIFARLRAARPGARARRRARRRHLRRARSASRSCPGCPFAYMRGFPAVRGLLRVSSRRCSSSTRRRCCCRSRSSSASRFPAAVAATAELARMGRGVGRVTAWNTVGTVGGAFLGGLRPRSAPRPARHRSRSPRRPRPSAACSRCRGATRREAGGTGPAAAAAALVAALLLPAWPRGLLAQGAGFYAAIYGTREGLARRRSDAPSCSSTRTASRRRSRSTGRAPYRFYRSNGKTDASTDPGDMANQLLLGHLPMLLHPDPKDVFVLGLGTGVSAAAVARYPVRSIDIADIEGAVREATQFFAPENRNILAGPARALPRRRRPQRAARPRQDLRRHHLRPLRRLGRRRRQPLHAGVLRARAPAPEARRRDGPVVPHALAAARADEADRRDVSLGLSARVVLAAQPRRRDPHGQRRAGAVGPRAAPASASRRVPGVARRPASHRLLAPALDLRGLRPRRRRPRAHARRTSQGSTPTTARSSSTCRRAPATRTRRPPTTPASRRCRRRRSRAIAGFDEARDLDARARYLLGFGMASIGRIDPAIRAHGGERPRREAGPEVPRRARQPVPREGLDREGGAPPTSGRSSLDGRRRRRRRCGSRSCSAPQGDEAGAEKVAARRAARSRRATRRSPRAAARSLLDGGRAGRGARGARAGAREGARGRAALRLLDGRGARRGRPRRGCARRRCAGRRDRRPDSADIQRARRATRCSRSATWRAPRAAYAPRLGARPRRRGRPRRPGAASIPERGRRGGARRARRARSRSIRTTRPRCAAR